MERKKLCLCVWCLCVCMSSAEFMIRTKMLVCYTRKMLVPKPSNGNKGGGVIIVLLSCASPQAQQVHKLYPKLFISGFRTKLQLQLTGLEMLLLVRLEKSWNFFHLAARTNWSQFKTGCCSKLVGSLFFFLSLITRWVYNIPTKTPPALLGAKVGELNHSHKRTS